MLLTQFSSLSSYKTSSRDCFLLSIIESAMNEHKICPVKYLSSHLINSAQQYREDVSYVDKRSKAHVTSRVLMRMHNTYTFV